MTSRERNLLAILGAASAAVLLIFAIDAYLGRLARLDDDFIAMKKKAAQLATSAATSGGVADESEAARLQARFFAAGTLPEAIRLAETAGDALRRAGVTVIESGVTKSTATEQWMKYRAEGDVDAWFRFLRLLDAADGRCLFRSLSLVRKDGVRYSMTFEVGHAVLP